MAANPKAPSELQRLLDKAYRDYQTDLDNLREGAADVIENMVDRDPLNVKDAIRDFSRDASQLANEYYDTVRGLWSEYAGVRLDDFDHTRLIDPDRALWQVQGGFNGTDYAGLTYTQVKNGQSRAGATIDDLWPDLGNPDDAMQFVADMVNAAARLTTQRNMRIDPSKPRWARVPRGARTCAFCTMLASRGFTYLSEDSAGLEMQYHRDCDCQIVPSWDARHSPDTTPNGSPPCGRKPARKAATTGRSSSACAGTIPWRSRTAFTRRRPCRGSSPSDSCQ